MNIQLKTFKTIKNMNLKMHNLLMLKHTPGVSKTGQ